MTAPDPTAGEAVTDPDTGIVYFPDDPTPNPNAATRTSPPAVAASTGTSEDVEALAEVLLAVDVTPAERAGMPFPASRYLIEGTGGDFARAVLASDWLAAREAAARAEVVAGVRAWCAINEIAAPPLDWEGLGEFLARVAREVRP